MQASLKLVLLLLSLSFALAGAQEYYMGPRYVNYMGRPAAPIYARPAPYYGNHRGYTMVAARQPSRLVPAHANANATASAAPSSSTSGILASSTPAPNLSGFSNATTMHLEATSTTTSTTPASTSAAPSMPAGVSSAPESTTLAGAPMQPDAVVSAAN